MLKNSFAFLHTREEQLERKNLKYIYDNIPKHILHREVFDKIYETPIHWKLQI